MMYRLAPFFCAVLCVVSLGCSRGGPEIVPLEGTLSHNGDPVPNMRIYFVPTDGRPSWGDSDASGHFKLSYDPEHVGAKVGSHTIWVVDLSGNVDETAAMSGAARPKRSPAASQLVAKYGRDKSTLKVEVKKADRNFQLKLE
jgi:hypothetical protein